MDCHKILYKPIKSRGIYDSFLEKLKEKQITERKEDFYDEILKFKSSRYPREFIEVLQRQINPFQCSLETLKKRMNKRFPQYSEQLVNETVQYIYTKKYRKANTIKQSATIIEDGSQYIRNGRKLMKEDFSYLYTGKNNHDTSSLMLTGREETSRSSPIKFLGKNDSIQKRIRPTNEVQNQQNPQRRLSNYSINSFTERERTSSFQRIENFNNKNQAFNEILSNELKKQSLKYEEMQLICQDDQNDILKIAERSNSKKLILTDRSGKDDLSKSFPYFHDKDVVVEAQGMQTGRSDIEELNHLLSQFFVITEQSNGDTSRSANNLNSLRIHKQNMNALYDAQGNLKIHIVKKAINKMKNNEY